MHAYSISARLFVSACSCPFECCGGVSNVVGGVSNVLGCFECFGVFPMFWPCFECFGVVSNVLWCFECFGLVSNVLGVSVLLLILYCVLSHDLSSVYLWEYLKFRNSRPI